MMKACYDVTSANDACGCNKINEQVVNGHSELIYSLGMGMCRRVDVTVVQGVTLMLFFVQGVNM